MTVVARRFRSIPHRSACETWAALTELLAPSVSSGARAELEAVEGIAASIITREAMKELPMVVCGAGPRLRVYCLHDEEAIAGDAANEQVLAFVPTDGDWKISLPCPAEDLTWVQEALGKKSTRVTARDQTQDFADSDDGGHRKTVRGLQVNEEEFFRS